MLHFTGELNVTEPSKYLTAVFDWDLLVENIQSPCQENMQEAMKELHRLFFRGVRFYVSRQTGSLDLNDTVHKILATVVRDIRQGDLPEPNRLVSLVRTVTNRELAAYVALRNARDRAEVDSALCLVADKGYSEEQPITRDNKINRDDKDVMVEILRSMSRIDCDVLTRFYLHGQNVQQICSETGVTNRHFGLLKSGTKARFSSADRAKIREQSSPPLSA